MAMEELLELAPADVWTSRDAEPFLVVPPNEGATASEVARGQGSPSEHAFFTAP
jgi:hypothetical protein